MADRFVAWRNMAYEDGSIGGLGSFALQVRGDGLPGSDWQRQHVLAQALGVAQNDRAGSPVDVVEIEPCNFAAAKAEIQGTAHDRSRRIERPFTQRFSPTARLLAAVPGQRRVALADWTRRRSGHERDRRSEAR
jgi:hypothetical protein